MERKYITRIEVTNTPVVHRTQFYTGIHLPNMVVVMLLLYLSTGCKKWVEVDAPVTSSNALNVYSSDATAIAVLTGLYTRMSEAIDPSFSTGNKSISLQAGLSSDELTLYGGVTNPMYIAYYKNALSATTSPIAGSEFWSQFYNCIFTCNSAIEGLTDASSLTPKVKQQLLGEAKFMRSFFYFYLVNLFGGVPLVTSTNSTVNSTLGRSSKSEVYQQIISDLKEAQSLLSLDYLDRNLQNYTDIPERVRPTRWAATALLSRVYLYNEDYINAEVQAAMIINYPSLYSLPGLNAAFLSNSNEAIWQLQPVNSGRNTEDAFTFIIPDTGPSDDNPVFISPQLLNSFEAKDDRKKNWTNSITIGSDTLYYPYKYKSATQDEPVTEYLMIFRLAEQYLIRAEARAQQGNLTGAKSDLDIVRSRALLTGTAATTKSTLLDAILHERQIELFTEWGHRWLDLKRTKRIDAVMTVVTPQKGGIWNANWQLYPIPFSDIQKDANLTQNPGY